MSQIALSRETEVPASNSLKRSDLVSSAIVSFHLLCVLSAVYASVIFRSFYLLPLFWLWFGLGMNGLLNLMHECAHLHVFKKRGGSVFVGRWILGPLSLADFDAFQKRHWQHHRRLGETDDPKYIYHESIH